MQLRRPSVFLFACAVLWMAAVGFGMQKLWAYAFTAGPPALAAHQWPSASALNRDPAKFTLVLFAHPQCSCSRASIGELARLVTDVRDRLRVVVAVYRPANAEPGWEHTDLWDSAAAIPGVQVMSDEDGGESLLFGALVSGQTMLYGPDGRLVFSGGITLGRGHAGDNAGRDALESWLMRGIGPASAPVFGCFIRPEAVSPRGSDVG